MLPQTPFKTQAVVDGFWLSRDSGPSLHCRILVRWAHGRSRSRGNGAFGLGDGLFDGMELLGNVGTGPLRPDHLDHAQKVPVGSFQSLDDVRVGCVVRMFYHKHRHIPRGGQGKRAKTCGNWQMTRQATIFLRFALTIALAVGLMLSSSGQSKLHDLAKIAEIIAQHQAEIEDHGHAHDDIVDVIHVYQSHAHEVAEHEHNIAFLPPRRGISFDAPARINWSLTEVTMSDRVPYDLDRPPRV